MTRKEAIDKCKEYWASGSSTRAMIDSLVALGLLQLETTTDKDRVAAAERLQNTHVGCYLTQSNSNIAKLSLDGAYEILDILTKSGFRITREP